MATITNIDIHCISMIEIDFVLMIVFALLGSIRIENRREKCNDERRVYMFKSENKLYCLFASQDCATAIFGFL